MDEKFEIMVPKFGNLFYRKNNVAYTHNGVFHADDVCSAALLQIVFPGIEIKRVSQVPETAELAFDIGYGKYDHHQSDAELREDGNRYASFGLLWRDIGPLIVDKDDTKFFDDVFVKGIDYTDNTGYPNPFSSAIKAFNPTWDSEESADDCFAKAVEFAKTAIVNQLNRYRSAVNVKSAIDKILHDETSSHRASLSCLLLEKYIPCQRYLVNTDINFMMYPSNRQIGYWNISTIPTEVGGKIPKVKFPEEWLKHPPVGCTFVHPALWITTFKTKQDAISAINSHDTLDINSLTFTRQNRSC